MDQRRSGQWCRLRRSDRAQLANRLGRAGHRSSWYWSICKARAFCNTTIFFLNIGAAKTDGPATVTGRLGVDLDRTLLYVKVAALEMHESR